MPDRVARSSLRNRIIVLHLIVFALLVCRRPDAVFRPQFWAEDGTVFFADQLTVGFWHALFIPYSGYLHVAPRMLAALFSGIRLQFLPMAYGISSILVAAFCCSAFAWPRFRNLLASDVVRFVCCLLMATAIPTGSELIGSITNLQWFLAPVGILIAFSEPETNHKAVLLATVILLAVIGLSTPGLFVVLPLFLWQIATKRGWMLWNSLALMVALGIELIEVVHTKAGGNKQHWNFDSVLISTLAGGIAKCVLAPVLGTSLLLGQSNKSFVATMLLALLIGLAGLTLLVSAVPEWRRRMIILSAAHIGVASVVVVMGGRSFAEPFLTPANIPHIQGERYFFLGSCVFLFLAGVTADFAMGSIRHPAVRKLPALALFLLFSLGMVRNFSTPPLVDLSWPHYAEQIEQWDSSQRQGKAVDPLQIPLNPPPFSVTLEPRR